MYTFPKNNHIFAGVFVRIGRRYNIVVEVYASSYREIWKISSKQDGQAHLHRAWYISHDIFCMVWSLVYLFAGIPEPLY